MSKETKLEYGFLFVGVGTSYLIGKLFGSIGALICAAFFMLLGIGLLLAGHLHRDKTGVQPQRGIMGTIVMFTLIGTICGALIGYISGAIWTIAQKDSRRIQPPGANTIEEVAGSQVSPPPDNSTPPSLEKPGTVEELQRTTADVHVAVKRAPSQTVTAKVDHPAERGATRTPSGKNSVTPTAGPKPIEKPPALTDLFARDFPYTMKVTDEIGIQWKEGSVLHIKRQVYLEFDGKTDFVGFYIPSSDPLSDTTYRACLALVNSVQQALDDFPKRVAISGGYRDESTTIQDLTFSGRVFLYHMGFLSITQKAEIIKAYKAKNIDVQFRGPDYLGDQVMAWHRQHDPKE